jgi:hypothetical protein
MLEKGRGIGNGTLKSITRLRSVKRSFVPKPTFLALLLVSPPSLILLLLLTTHGRTWAFGFLWMTTRKTWVVVSLLVTMEATEDKN